MTSLAKKTQGAGAFLRQMVAQLADRRWLPLAFLFFLFLGGTNALLAIYKPAAGERPGLLFVIAALIRVASLVWLSVAALRIAAASPRRRWVPDGAFWLYFLLSFLALGASALGVSIGRGLPDLARILVMEAVAVVLIAPFTVWMVAAAVERPVAWSPAPYFRRLGAWLPSLLLWALLLIVPLASLHAFFSLRLVETVASSAFWPLVVGDALLSTILVMLMLALRITAYRSVARG